MAIIGDALSVLALKASVHVTTMPGASVSFIKEDITVATMTADENGNCDYEILVPNFGSWTVSASSGLGSGSSTVTVSDTTTYNVTVTLELWIIKNGDVVNGFSVNGVGSHHYYDDAGAYIEMKTYQGGSNEQDSWYYNPTVAFGYWKTLVVDTQSVGDPAYAGVSNNNSSNPPSFAASVKLNNRAESWPGRHTSSVSVASVTGSKYIAFSAKAWLYSESIPVHGAGGALRIWNAYLTG